MANEPAAGGQPGTGAGAPPAAGGDGGAPAGGAPPPAAGAPAAGAPHAGGAPAAGGGAPAGGAPRAGGAPPKGKGGGGGRKVVTIPEHELKARLEREAAKIIKNRFGLTPEELEARLAAPAPAAGGAAPAPAPAAQGVDPAIAERLRKQQKDIDTLTSRTQVLKERIDKTKRRERAKRVELVLGHEALVAGIAEANIDFALDKYRKAVASSENPPEARAFFAGLKTTMPYLFTGGAPAPEVPLAPTTAGPTGGAPGGDGPVPAPAGTARAPAGKSVDDMTDEEFRDYKRTNYGSRR